MEFLQSLLGSASSDLSSLLIYVIIVAVFIVGLVLCIAPVVGTRGRLRAAIRSIKAGRQRPSAPGRRTTSSARDALKAHWSAYLNNLFFADGEYHNATNVEDFINEETAIYGPGPRRLCRRRPEPAGLPRLPGHAHRPRAPALPASTWPTPPSAQQSIVALIPGMRYAFVTSIFGVIGSITVYIDYPRRLRLDRAHAAGRSTAP